MIAAIGRVMIARLNRVMHKDAGCMGVSRWASRQASRGMALWRSRLQEGPTSSSHARNKIFGVITTMVWGRDRDGRCANQSVAAQMPLRMGMRMHEVCTCSVTVLQFRPALYWRPFVIVTRALVTRTGCLTSITPHDFYNIPRLLFGGSAT